MAAHPAPRMAGRQSSPDTGKLSARPAGKPGDFFTFWRICDDPFPTTLAPGPQKHQAPGMRFQGMTESIGPMWLKKPNHQDLRMGCRLPLVGPRASVKDATEGTRLGSSSAMSSGRLFLDRVARQQSPSPLHRHAQATMHLRRASLKPERSTLLQTGSFYFALTSSECTGADSTMRRPGAGSKA